MQNDQRPYVVSYSVQTEMGGREVLPLLKAFAGDGSLVPWLCRRSLGTCSGASDSYVASHGLDFTDVRLLGIAEQPRTVRPEV